MQITQIATNLLDENCWIIRNAKNEIVVIDPGSDAAGILAEIGDALVAWILLTHSHFDHLEALATIWEKTGGKVAIHHAEANFVETGECNPPGFGKHFSPTPVARKLEGGEILDFGNLEIEVIHTPGHSPGSCCFQISGELFSGDTLFRENVGRWNLAGGNLEDLRQSLAKLLALPNEIKIHPGHDEDWTMGEARNFHFPI